MIRLGYIHMPRYSGVPDPYGSAPYAYVSYRVWYMPWRWGIAELHYAEPDKVIAANMSAAAAKGLLKILEVYPNPRP